MSNNHQFSRYVEVEIRDFKSNRKTLIGNDFEVDFEYFKTLDQAQEDDSGRITIFGLSLETIKALQFEGGEVVLRCGYRNSSVQTLFIANIGRLYYEKTNNTNVMIIECSANLLNHYFTGSISSTERGQSSTAEFFRDMALKLGYGGIRFHLDNVPEDKREDVIQYLESFEIKSYHVGSVLDVLKATAEIYGIAISAPVENKSQNPLVLTLTHNGVSRILKSIVQGYSAKPANLMLVNNSSSGELFSTFQEDELSNNLTILNYKTGLINQKKEYKIAYAYSDQALANTLEDPENPETKLADKKKDKTKSGKSNGATDGSEFVSNSFLSGLKIKWAESTAGGRVRRNTADFARLVQSYVGNDLKYFSGFNDTYHQVHAKTSEHTKGKAFDIVLNDKSKYPRVLKGIRDLSRQQGYSTVVDDEFTRKSATADGGDHIHIEVHGKSNSTDSGIKNTNQQPVGQAYEIEITKRNITYNRVTALLNPNIKPQSLVAILEDEIKPEVIEKSADFKSNSEGSESLVDANYGVYRVRSCNYKGNNKSGDWVVEILCENPDSRTITEAEQKTLSAQNSAEVLDIQEDKGNTVEITAK